MSTFTGVMEGFEDIRVDYFRPTSGLPTPRACFLSHIHSDHLQGLESKLWRTSPIYCSPPTREILLRLETKMNRIGYETKVLEARKVQYGHLDKLLKPIPLETPTIIELKPGITLQVTLFDANHCTGAVMFLFELEGTAVLYTGDIRSEPYFVNSLLRNPLLIEYTTGSKTLDCIYLDTSNTEPRVFPPKADGLKELLEKVSKYPVDTVFHLTTWTYGYEEVWMALSKALKSQIHVSKYAFGIYKSLRGEKADKKGPATAFHIHEGAALTGYTCGNRFQPGCLTTDPTVRIHSCEKGFKCSMLNKKTVWIQPIVRRRSDGTEEAEPAIVQAGNDLSGCSQIEFDEDVDIDQLMNLFAGASDHIRQDVRQMLSKVLATPGRVLSLSEFGLDDDNGDISLPQLAKAIIQAVTESSGGSITRDKGNGHALQKIITFPYSRHSSYEELCDLLKIFKPKDVWPCTEDPYHWHEVGRSVQGLFGEHCSEQVFRYDQEMRQKVAEAESRHVCLQSQTTASSQISIQSISPVPKRRLSIAISMQGAKETSASLLKVTDGSSDIGMSPLSAVKGEFPSPKLVSAEGGSAASKDLRRKSNVNEVESPQKRPRPNPDVCFQSNKTLTSLYLANASKGTSTGHAAGHASQPLTISSDGSDVEDRNKPGSDADIEESSEDDTDTEPLIFFDTVDEVHRCTACKHEIWGGERGSCGYCDEGATGPAYIEEALRTGPMPQITYDDYMEEVVVDSAVVKEIVGDCLDYDSSAYDSQDEVQEFAEEYEDNSMIDDEQISEAETDDETSSSEEKEDWEAKFKALQTRHFELVTAYEDLEEEHEDFRREMLDDFDDIMEDTDMDVDGMLIVDVATPNPVATDIILSQAREQSQDSEVSEERIKDRVDAFEAAREGEWHGVELISVAGNHSIAEIEL
ncbi:uncharacterized protein RSE6_07276 [Rhynchosporium secalis]|uniref:Protein artemis n=1 Tax=Rhynchosporium secalis TaxID=38038 RepID=A0A1E1MCI0_RHYSE|nr:uncharacterized protein RSE6_07276 [Rhynchosporium secalis]